MSATAATDEIRACRQALGLTLEAFAARFGVTLRAVQHWEAGDRQPSGPALTLVRQMMRGRETGGHMKGLSVRQPWAWAIIHGGKTIENRSRPIAYRGPLVIHASKSRADIGELPEAPPEDKLDFGALIGVVDLVDCVPFAKVCGNRWASGPWCWILANPRPIAPVQFKGFVSLFNVPSDLVREVTTAIATPVVTKPDPTADGYALA